MPRINDVSQPDEIRRVERTDARRTEEKRSEVRAESGQPSDSVELSPSARQAREMETRLQEEARDISDVREDRVAEVRQRLQSGELDRDEVNRVIADRLLEQFGI
ncbi:MAG: flagellar biosynthesis anti-sigma factor FlgM [bacterium]|nr:flagellar biosynthesis anti-sigma factor FlgM [bacterium]